MKSSTIVNGTADLDGGGAYCTGTASFSDCTIKSNNSGRSGGGIFACTGVSIDGCKIINNKAGTSGADIAAAQVGLSIFDTADEYRSMYSEDLTSGNFSLCSWFSDKESDRYAPDHAGFCDAEIGENTVNIPTAFVCIIQSLDKQIKTVCGVFTPRCGKVISTHDP